MSGRALRFAQEITTIPVVMDVGYWVRIKDQDKLKITLKQELDSLLLGLHHDDRRDQQLLDVLLLDRQGQAKTARMWSPAIYGCSVSPANIDAPGGTLTACAKIDNADLSKVPGGSKGVHVANVTIKVVPRACP